MTAPPRRWCAVAGLAVVLGVSACRPQDRQGEGRRIIVTAELDQLHLGQTTPTQVEDLFGAPDQREADGAITYTGRVAARANARPDESVTFRFENGLLSKICRTRS